MAINERGLLTVVALFGSVAAAFTAAAQNSGSPPPLLTDISQRQRLDVCIWPDYYAISFRNPRNGELTGIDIDMAQALASDLKVTVRFVDTSFGRFMDDLEAKKCDIAMFGIGQTTARAERVALTEPHLRSGVYAITTANSAYVKSWADVDREGGVVAVQSGTFMEPFMRSYLKKAKLLSVERPGAREEAVISGRADVFITDYPYARRMRFQHEWAVIIAPPKPLAETSYGFAVRKGDEQWLARVNAFVVAVRKDGRLEAAAKRHELTPALYRN